MNQKILINASETFTRIALVENETLAELYIESDRDQRMLGNIYLGTVTRVLPGMQAVFVDIGLEKDAFLYIQDASLIGESHQSIQHEDDEEPALSDTDEAIAATMRLPVDQMIQPGQKLMVQITREPQSMKGARVTAHITLPGRYVVMMPTVNHIGVSKRIESEAERDRLKSLVDRMRNPSTGMIVRTVAEGRNAIDFESDLEFLTKIWSSIQMRAKRNSAPVLLHQDVDPISRVLRDLFSDSVSEVLVDSRKEYERCVDFVSTFAPHLIERIGFYDEAKPLFENYKIESEIERALQRKVWLPLGGYLVIDQTEALVAIDVNTGRYVGKENFEETVLETNLEAARVIAYQVRLRDLSGIIVVDFIDMEKQENRDKVLDMLRNSFSRDRSRINIGPFTTLGLIEMTRKRLKRSLQDYLMQSCPCCHGIGLVKQPQMVAHQLFRDLNALVNSMKHYAIQITLNPALKPFLNAKFENLKHLMESQGKSISIVFDKEMQIENYDIVQSK
jgi:ribonuclease G